MKFHHKIAIIGGLGPFAGAYALERLLTHASSVYGSSEDHEFPEIILHSIPFESTSHLGIENEHAVRKALQRSLLMLHEDGVQAALIACNSSHAFFPRLQILHQVELISLVNAIKRPLLLANGDTVSVLSSRSSRACGVFTAVLKETGKRERPLPESLQAEVDYLITLSMKPILHAETAQRLHALIKAVSANGEHSVVIGCTELSRLFSRFEEPLPFVIDTLDEALRILLLKAL